MSQPSDLEQFIQQIRDFVGNRPVRLLTRKASSKDKTGVAYETVFPKAPEFGTLQVFIRADDKEAVTAVNVTELYTKHLDYWDDDAMGRDKEIHEHTNVLFMIPDREHPGAMTATRTNESGDKNLFLRPLTPEEDRQVTVRLLKERPAYSQGHIFGFGSLDIGAALHAEQQSHPASEIPEPPKDTPDDTQ